MNDREQKPSRRYFAKALPRSFNGGYFGNFGAPGLTPDFVCQDGKRMVFDDPINAEAEAHRALLEMLNARATQRYKFEKLDLMQPIELSEALDEAGISPTQLAFILHSDKVERWLAGTTPIPHHVRVMMALLQDPKNLDIAESTVEGAIKEEAHV